MMLESIAQLLHGIITLYIWVVIIASLLTFVQPDPNNTIVMTLNKLTSPALDFVREKMPFVMFSGIDLSPVVVVIGLQIVDIVIRGLLIG